MPIEPREPSEIRFFDAIRKAYLEGWTGRLGLNSADLSGASCSLSAGDLYLSPRPPFRGGQRAAWASSLRATPTSSRAVQTEEEEVGSLAKPIRIGGSANQDEMPKARLATRRLISELTDLLDPCARESCHFVDGAGQIRLDLIGPLANRQT